MRGSRIKNQAFTPKDWLPVAAAIGTDANERVALSMRDRLVTEANDEYREKRGKAWKGDGAGGGDYDRDELAIAQRELRAAQMRADAAEGRLRDLAVHVGPGATMGTGAPAFYREADREIVLDSAVALPGVDPASVRWDDPLWRAEHLRAAGLVEHEVGHAAHTPRRVLAEWHRAGRDVEAFARRIEETRMEAAAIRDGADRAALAGVAHELILREFEGVSGDRFGDAMDAALILGRSELHGGSLPDADVDRFREAYGKVHGDEWVRQVEELVGDWNSTEDDAVPDGDGMRELLGSWRSAIGAGESEQPTGEAGPDVPLPSAESESDANGSGESGEGEGSESAGDEQDGDGDGDGSSSDEDTDEDGDEDEDGGGGGGQEDDEADDTDPADAIRELLEAAAGEAGTAAAEAAAEMREREEEEDRKMTEAVTHGYSPGEQRHHHTETLPVESADRRFAVELSRRMRSLALPEVARAHKASTLPPGRLRGRGMVLQEAQRDLGMIPTAEPWRTTRKTVTRTPPPVVGIMLDVSGSMRVAQRPAAVAAWALAEAGRSVQARTAMVTFGDRGRLVEHSPTSLTVTDCGGSWENFREAFALLDQKLHLTTPAQGARLLVCVSDGALVGPDEGQAAARIMRRLESQGVVCVWLPIGTAWAGHWGEGWTNRGGHVIECPDPDPAAITEGVAAAMRRVRVSL